MAATQSNREQDKNSEVNKTNKKLDYDKLITRFGCERIDDDLLSRIERITGKSVHHLIRRGVFFAHRDLHQLLDHYEKGYKFYLYAGLGPTVGSLHLGHLIPLIMAKWLQETFNVPLVIQMTDDEKVFFKNLNLEQSIELGLENNKDLIALGFDASKTFIFSNTIYMGKCSNFYQNVLRVSKCVTFNQVRRIFGFNESDVVGKILFPAIEVAPALSTTFPMIFGDKKVPLLIPCAIDQDPFFRLNRDIAPRLGFPKPALMHSQFFPSLQDPEAKINTVDPNNAIFLTDSMQQIENKINKYAFSGGRATVDEHQQLGGNTNIDISFQLLRYFLEDDEEVERIRKLYSSGEMLSGEIKKIAIETIQKLIHDFQEARKNVTDETLKLFMTPRSLNF